MTYFGLLVVSILVDDENYSECWHTASWQRSCFLGGNILTDSFMLYVATSYFGKRQSDWPWLVVPVLAKLSKRAQGEE